MGKDRLRLLLQLLTGMVVLLVIYSREKAKAAKKDNTIDVSTNASQLHTKWSQDSSLLAYSVADSAGH